VFVLSALVLEAVHTVGPGFAAAQSCTEQWRAHGHTTQAKAKAFAKSCLKKQGGIEQQLNFKLVMQKLNTLLAADQPLTALEPADVATFCPAYKRQSREGRAVFWRTLFATIAGPESGYNTATPYWETGRQQQYSIGLLQLSLSNEGNYKCGFKSEADITDPDRNLSCGIRIMTKRIRMGGVIGGDKAHFDKGGAAYWSTLRYTSDSRAELIKVTQNLSVCKI
jgi:hypothetical protein